MIPSRQLCCSPTPQDPVPRSESLERSEEVLSAGAAFSIECVVPRRDLANASGWWKLLLISVRLAALRYHRHQYCRELVGTRGDVRAPWRNVKVRNKSNKKFFIFLLVSSWVLLFFFAYNICVQFKWWVGVLFGIGYPGCAAVPSARTGQSYLA